LPINGDICKRVDLASYNFIGVCVFYTSNLIFLVKNICRNLTTKAYCARKRHEIVFICAVVSVRDSNRRRAVDRGKRHVARSRCFTDWGNVVISATLIDVVFEVRTYANVVRSI
jgi:hypothetical protein